LAASLLIAGASAEAQFNPSPTLKIGDPAPPIRVETWVRGQPLTLFEKGRVYVVDFWATWCGGCIMAFPHLNAIAEQYKDKVSFVSVDVYEDIDGKIDDPAAKVKSFLETPPAQPLKLPVAVDGNANTMRDTYIKSLRRMGLPTTYVIDQDGRVAWVDVNIDHLSWVLDEVLAKRWDLNKAAAIMEQRDKIDDGWMATFREKDSVKKAKLVRSLLTESEKFEDQFPDRKDAVAFYKFMALLELDTSKLAAILEQMAADPRSRYINLSDAALLSLRRKDLSKATYLAVVKVMQRCLKNEHPQLNNCGPNSTGYERLAAAYDMAGDPVSAATNMEKALTLANEEKVPADKIKELQTTLGKYKSAAARKS
jgi:thiol-disulfide isomerase/thioredoxin